VATLAIVYFARVFQIPSGVPAQSGIGDWVDSYFINYLLEHWRYSLLHLTNPATPPMFYPEPGAIGVAACLVSLRPRSVPRVGLVSATVLLLALFWNREVLLYRRSIDTFQQFVATPLAIDPSCRSFYITKASPTYNSRSFHQATLYGVDAMFVALRHSIPTLNGYSAWLPDNWNLDNPQDPGYTEALERWIARHQLSGVCELDIEARTMKPGRMFR